MRRVALLAVLLAACKPAPPPPLITQLKLTIVPADGGSAYVEYDRDGAIRGGHLSGDSVPFVHIAEGRLDSAALRVMWDSAQSLGDTLLTRRDSVPASGRGYIAMQIIQEGREARLVWPERTEHLNRRVQYLGTMMMRHRVGGW